ncbi:hypothetical protein [Helicobacter cetorum]|uniref:Uncharacterized protein n=1 Tax=Helicobacter cetorum (strain ATCC BAA-540 / CCUG 52418 / MIT 99-5656) TaxID=1163745 RepID=I0ESL6_HELCM|nr:hypothetical protein [Helicobacter cetorum]AFI05935.1 hypothetical protein HCD_04645 [Helicobacter cetorum MIT 99-5656]
MYNQHVKNFYKEPLRLFDFQISTDGKDFIKAMGSKGIYLFYGNILVVDTALMVYSIFQKG